MEREQLLKDITAIIRAGGILCGDTPSGTFHLTVGPHRVAVGNGGYALWVNNRSQIRKSPRHVAQLFVSAVGSKAARAAVDHYRADHA
jgi:hypothetical protein